MIQKKSSQGRRKVAVLGTAGIPSKYGGFETLTENLTAFLGQKYDFTVYCSSRNVTDRRKLYNNAKLKYIVFKANGVESIFYDISSMLYSLRRFDVILILGVSGCIVLPFIKMLNKEKVIVNIDGMEWKRAKWNRLAKWFLKFSEKIAVNYSDVVIADNKIIQEHVLQEYGRKSTLIEYGGSHAEIRSIEPSSYEAFPFLKRKYAFTVCRIEPENNIDIIIDSFSKTGFPLIVVGNWTDSEYASNLNSRYGTLENIHLVPPIYDQCQLNEIRSNAYVYVHGHSAGGTNPSLVEAMYLGLPVFAFAVDFNMETTENQAFYFSNSEELSRLVRTMDDKTLVQLRFSMASIAKKRFRWDLISEQYARLFG